MLASELAELRQEKKPVKNDLPKTGAFTGNRWPTCDGQGAYVKGWFIWQNGQIGTIWLGKCFHTILDDNYTIL